MLKKKTKKIYKYTALFEPAEEGGYIVYIPALPGCVTQGDSFEEAQKMAQDAVKGYLAVLREDGSMVTKISKKELSRVFSSLPI